jgi:hypothetical protein
MNYNLLNGNIEKLLENGLEKILNIKYDKNINWRN